MKIATIMDHIKVLTYPSSALDMTPIKGMLFTSFGGALGVINGLLTTSQLRDTFVLGAAGAAGALTFTLTWALIKKLKGPLKKLGNYIKKIW